MDLSAYSYYLPQELIAKVPASPRDHSRLFIYDTKKDTIQFNYFYNLAKYLPSNSLMVLNNTKVLPARIHLYRKTGGKVIVFFLLNERSESNTVRFFVDRKVEVGSDLFTDGKKPIIHVVLQQEHIFTGNMLIAKKELFKLLEEQGTMPIPLYLRDTPLTSQELKEKYQTIFAKEKGSVAAPTASLHFTEDVFASLRKKKVRKTTVTLHVGMGTFAPITPKQMEEKRLHREWYEISRYSLKIIQDAKKKKIPVVGVGTTVVRTLESYGRTQLPMDSTDLFIYPPFQFTMIDHLITNFHLPQSSLMMLVEAFLQYKRSKRRLVDLYKIAIENTFRFYSFGDGMIIL